MRSTPVVIQNLFLIKTSFYHLHVEISNTKPAEKRASKVGIHADKFKWISKSESEQMKIQYKQVV